MPDFTSVPTVVLLTRAADAAGRVAANASTTGLKWSAITPGLADRLLMPELRLIAASGPDHWRAVEATLRGLLEIHRSWNPAASVLSCRGCGAYLAPDEDPTLLALRPLAEQVLRDLGDT